MPTYAAPEVLKIPLALIDEPALASRTEMDDRKLEELCDSMRLLGFISILVVVAIGARYRVVAGHRRTLAARRVGFVEVPCLVYADESAALDAIQHAENRFREELSVTDEAIWFSELYEKYPDEGTDGLAARVGESRSYVEGRLALLQGCPRVFAALAAKEISIGVAQKLNLCTDEAHRVMLLEWAIRSGATVGQAGQWVNEWKAVHSLASGHIQPGAAPLATATPLTNEYFRCRICGETHEAHVMNPVQIHDYCLRQLIDPATGLFRSRADYVEFPRTLDAARALAARLIDRFPDLTA